MTGRCEAGGQLLGLGGALNGAVATVARIYEARRSEEGWGALKN